MPERHSRRPQDVVLLLRRSPPRTLFVRPQSQTHCHALPTEWPLVGDRMAPSRATTTNRPYRWPVRSINRLLTCPELARARFIPATVSLCKQPQLRAVPLVSAKVAALVWPPHSHMHSHLIWYAPVVGTQYGSSFLITSNRANRSPVKSLGVSIMVALPIALLFVRGPYMPCRPSCGHVRTTFQKLTRHTTPASHRSCGRK